MRQRILAGPILILSAAIAEAASFTPLGDLPGGQNFSHAFAISADGSVVVGSSIWTSGFLFQAFRWTATDGLVGLGGLPGNQSDSFAYGVSEDGSVVVGLSGGIPDSGAFRWTAATGMVPLASDQGSNRPQAVSFDGTVVVGNNFATGEAFQWTSTGGFVGLGDFAGGFFRSEAFGVSGDGSVAVGAGTIAGDIRQAFKWTAANGMVSLGNISGGGTLNVANVAFAASADGSVIVGSGRGELGTEAFRWTADAGAVGLGDLPGAGFDSQARGVSADGSVVVGIGETLDSTGNADDDAFIWTEDAGMQRLLDVLVAQGVTGLDGWKLLDATGVSADGTAIVGLAEAPDGTRNAYLARVTLVPIPAAVWLLGSALGVLGVMRRHAAGITNDE